MEQTETRLRKRSLKYGILLVLLLFFLPLTGAAKVQAKTDGTVKVKNMIRAAEKNVVRKKKAELVTRGRKIRLRFTATGEYAKNEWLSYDGNIYCFSKRGYARTGFFKYKKRMYYADAAGHVCSGLWINIDGYSYYIKRNGLVAKKEQIKHGGITYTFDKKGRLTGNDAKGVKYLFAGDSRTEGMSMAVPKNDTRYIGKVSMGYSWLAGTAGPQIRNWLRSYPSLKVILCFGVNDLGNIASYIAYYRALVQEYPRATFYFMSVNPGRSYYVNNTKISVFNKKLKAAFGKRYIDTYTYLMKNGYSSPDGLHYSAETYRKIYNFIISKIK